MSQCYAISCLFILQWRRNCDQQKRDRRVAALVAVFIQQMHNKSK